MIMRGVKMKALVYAKELAGEIGMSEKAIRKFAKKYDDFPQIRNGNRRLFIADEVMAWLKENSTAGVRI